MKKKLMMVAVLLGALSLGACVDDNESASVTNIRNAKAEQLTALAEQARAEGEAAKILAEAEKAMADAKAAYLNEMTEEARQKFVETLKQIQAETEAAIKKAQLDAQRYEQALLREASQRVKDAYATYSTAAEELKNLKYNKTEASMYLAQLEAGLGNVQAFIDARTVELDNKIAAKTAERDAWNNYTGLDKSELKAQLKQLEQQETEAESAKTKAEADKTTATNVFDKATEVYYVSYEGESPVAAVAALQKYSDAVGSVMFVSSESYKLSETEASATLVRYFLTESGKFTGNEYWSGRGKADLEEQLGHKGSGNQIATGLYEKLEKAQKSVSDAKKKYEDADKQMKDLEASVATAEKQIADAKAAVETAKADQKAKEAAWKTAGENLTKVNNDPDATDVEKAQAKLDYEVANAAKELADATLEKAETDLKKIESDTAEDRAKYDLLKVQVPQYEQELYNANLLVANMNDAIARCIEEIEKFDANAKLWTAVVTALESEEYAKALEGLKKNSAITEYVAAITACKKADLALSEVQKQVGVVRQMVTSGNAYDAEEEIAKLNKAIARLQYQKDQLAYSNFDLDGNAGTPANSQANINKLIEHQKNYIAYLEDEISYKEQIVELFKADLEAAINAQDNSTDTPAEDQPAA